MVCFSSAQLCGQGAERIRANCIIGFFCTEAGCPNQSGPPVALRCGGDRLIFCGELGDRSPRLLFDGDRFMRGEFGADMLEDADEHAAASDFIVLSRMRAIVGWVGFIHSDVGDVGITTSRHRHVQGLSGHGRVDEHVGSIGGEALRAEGCHGVAEFDVLSYIVGWQKNAGPPGTSSPSNKHRSIASNIDDIPAISVAHPSSPCQ